MYFGKSFVSNLEGEGFLLLIQINQNRSILLSNQDLTKSFP